MAYRVRFRVRVKEVIRRAMKRVKVFRRKQTVDLEANRRPLIDERNMSISGMSFEMAQEFADDLREIIERQLIAWVPLSPNYVRRKRMMGLDSRILIATGRYVNSIQPIQQPDGGWLVNVPEEPMAPGSKHTLRDLARWLEYGTRTMPARPHWRPALNIWRTKIYQVKMRLRQDIVAELKKAGFR